MRRNDMTENYDSDNLFEMFKVVIRTILIACQEEKLDKIVEICNNAIKNIDRIQKREIIRKEL